MPYNPPFTLTEKMIDLVAMIMENIGRLKSYDGLKQLPRLRKVSRLKSIHSSLAIENNSLSLENVTEVIEGKKVLGKKEDILAVKNAFEAYKLIPSLNPNSISDLLKAHKIMMDGLIDRAGFFRNGGVGVFDSNGKAIHVAPPANMVQENMENLFSWLKEKNGNVLIKSCVFHYEFEYIHPFMDGNGRTGRLWQTVILSHWNPIFEWIPIESIVKDNQESYYKAIGASNAEASSTSFIEFMLSCIKKATDEIVTSSKNHYEHISKQVGKILSVIEYYPQSATELMKRLHLKSRSSFMEHYLKPALEMKLIAMTEPNKPNSRNQRYYKI